jgi:hypothetical protein
MNRRLLAHKDYSSTANFRTEILAIFRDTFINFVVLKNIYLFHNSSRNP